MPTIITDIRFTKNIGINGVTNSLAAAFWIIDIFMEFALMRGYGINFNADISGTKFQSIFATGSPSYTPSALYYGLIMVSLISNGSPLIYFPIITSISADIKVYIMENS